MLSWDNLINKGTGCGLGQVFFYLPPPPDWFGGSPSLLHNGIGALSPEVKQP
jgi:hypothetical protein